MTVEPETGSLVSEVPFPTFTAMSTSDDGVTSLTVTIDLHDLGDQWTFDSVIDVSDGKISILFFDEETL